MTNVIAFNLEPCLILAARFQNVRNVFERVFENSVIATFEIGFLPVMLEFFESAKHFIKAEIHGAHIERGNFWF
ncbi:hypothetical protein D3C75_935050 [compost metagenome]